MRLNKADVKKLNVLVEQVSTANPGQDIKIVASPDFLNSFFKELNMSRAKADKEGYLGRCQGVPVYEKKESEQNFAYVVPIEEEPVKWAYEIGEKLFLFTLKNNQDFFVEHTIVSRRMVEDVPAYSIKDEDTEEVFLFSEKFIKRNFSRKSTTQKDLRMYILVNEELKMSKGKVAAQVGHAVNVLIYNSLTNGGRDAQLVHEYMKSEIKKIVLSAPLSTLEMLEQKGHIAIRDKGYTQIEPDSLTCVTVGILDANQLSEFSYLKQLKLYR
jgi:peptidyl-tRNA hydrolase, PTH2 family